ncbi:hypothetical protein B0H11DRAFT_1273284 [Mycena galericulata]|nr:hypothetical protein B0H11DRAFT_1273284 [Mycena galericulata]
MTLMTQLRTSLNTFLFRFHLRLPHCHVPDGIPLRPRVPRAHPKGHAYSTRVVWSCSRCLLFPSATLLFLLPPPYPPAFSFAMSLALDISLFSSFTQTQDFVVRAPVKARKTRPVGIVFDKSLTIAQNHNLDSNGVSPDFDSRPISPVSESSQSSDDTANSTIVGFGRKRHSVLPTVPVSSQDLTASTIVGFGRKRHHHRHSIAVAPSSLITATDRKHENRRSLPVILRDVPVFPDPKRKRASLDLSGIRPPQALSASTVRVLGAARKVSGNILGPSRQPPKPLLLAQHVQARESLSGRVKRRLVGQITSVASSRPVQRFVCHFSSEPRLKPLKMGRHFDASEEHMYIGENFEQNRIPPSLIERLLALLLILVYRWVRHMLWF